MYFQVPIEPLHHHFFVFFFSIPPFFHHLPRRQRHTDQLLRPPHADEVLVVAILASGEDGRNLESWQLKARETTTYIHWSRHVGQYSRQQAICRNPCYDSRVVAQLDCHALVGKETCSWLSPYARATYAMQSIRRAQTGSFLPSAHLSLTIAECLVQSWLRLFSLELCRMI